MFCFRKSRINENGGKQTHFQNLKKKREVIFLAQGHFKGLGKSRFGTWQIKALENAELGSAGTI